MHTNVETNEEQRTSRALWGDWLHKKCDQKIGVSSLNTLRSLL